MKFAYLKKPKEPQEHRWMAKILLLAALLVRTFVSAGQPVSTIDSLSRVVRQHPARDSIRVLALLRLADATVYTDPATAMREADEALEIAEAVPWTKGIALAWRQKGNAFYVFTDNPAALDCYIKALNISRPLNIRELDASLYNNLANIYSDQRQYTKALGYYQQFLDAARQLGSRKEEVIALVNMATVYSELGDQEKSIATGRKALSVCEEPYYVPIIFNNMGVAYKKLGRTDSARTFFRRSIAEAERSNNMDAKASSLEELGKVFLAEGDLASTESNALQSLAIARQLQSAEWQASAWQSLYEVYQKRRQFDSALDAYQQFIVFRDSMTNDAKQSVLTKKEMQFDFERKEAATQAEIDRQGLIRKGLIAGVLILVLAGIATFILYKRRRDAEERRVAADLKARVADTEMKVLRLQMNPHFIFNSLNSVSDYISKNETTTANYFLSKFAKMMRQVLEHSERSEITLAEDLQVVETYIQLELLRLRNDLSYEIVVGPGIDPEATMVPPLIVQPFVENSIWHGLSGQDRKGRISIRISREEGMIRYVVEDNGIGRAAAGRRQATGKQSMGLRITRDRIDIINQQKGVKAGVEVFDLSGGTRVELILPLELNY
jgi:tetratricopeptide (TPR) repeat protein